MLKFKYLSNKKLSSMNSKGRMEEILKLIKEENIILIDGRLNSIDEANLIRETMNSINDEFNGLEIGIVHDNHEHNLITRIKHNIAKILIGESTGLTIIGPAKIISELKQNPESIEIYFHKDYINKYSKGTGKNNIKKK